MASIILENVTVDFLIYGHLQSFRTTLLSRAGGLIRREGKRSERVSVRSLNSISLVIEHGDRVALIGHNGAGKSTLLRVIAGVYEPIAGRAIINGRVSPLFNTSPGLNLEDTGYENMLTCGLFLGMTRKEIRQKTPNIEQFTELGQYLSFPVRTYSSGMLMRLGFAIATAIDPEILLLDEGLGAGDARFVEHANKRIDALVSRSSILVLASHTETLIESMCNKAILMDQGQIVMAGTVSDVLKEYRRTSAASVAS
ncbi:MAG TPA: ABC transporter ATP-binding protein [Burkholderiales bacterium]|nr:ABC transporter ATP-binding protein [Burkholderiales bacterium]